MCALVRAKSCPVKLNLLTETPPRRALEYNDIRNYFLEFNPDPQTDTLKWTCDCASCQNSRVKNNRLVRGTKNDLNTLKRSFRHRNNFLEKITEAEAKLKAQKPQAYERIFVDNDHLATVLSCVEQDTQNTMHRIIDCRSTNYKGWGDWIVEKGFSDPSNASWEEHIESFESSKEALGHLLEILQAHNITLNGVLDILKHALTRK